ncbi:hypothetical protein [Gordonia liuliyuniae]|uniref:Uncharacterized protein n=1 Tax=Gordonia liuliyuniae TaxID=2911517 RepID=A0ABS9IWH8_9ACTN|nr:hypothetical protein [Gordonia liuliyuniae]MCF8589911.1 hypothetical protein [Gordonia liuliyuniae]
MLEDVISARNTSPVVAVLLSQVIASAASGDVFAEILVEMGLPVLRTRIPRLERFAQSFGRNVSPGIYRDVAEELLTSVKRYEPGFGA